VAHARARGLALPDDVVHWLLTHAPRDMSALVATLEALDRYSLARGRPVTLPLAREWMLSTPPADATL
ncbi:MAG: DnaA regulatory inactivator Hda, partial [Proteobacteria bacterium]|nr:DnaA regulatory inactivator Hda [Pseudomonadota bacterium]